MKPARRWWAAQRAFELTDGQPWLVNVLAKEIVDEIVIDRAQVVAVADVDAVKNVLIRRQTRLAERTRAEEAMSAGGRRVVIVRARCCSLPPSL